VRAGVRYLPEYLRHAPRRVWGAWRRVRRAPGYRHARSLYLADLRRDFSANRIRRFGQALVLAAELPSGIDWLYAHFLHTPASVARYAACMRGLAWSVSAHAKDIWTTPEWEKREKLSDAAWAVTCTALGAEHLNALAPGRVTLMRHGIDLARFPLLESAPSARDGSDPKNPVIIVSVGRAVAKKGYDDLLAALARLPADLAWRFVHVGGGALGGELAARAHKLGIAERVTWRGAATQEEVLRVLREADVFALASRVAADGDRDGLPNVLMEAMSQGLAVVTTSVSSIPELVTDGLDGALVAPGDIAALAKRIEALAREPWARLALGQAARERVRRDFDFTRHIGAIIGRLREPLATAAF
jgi:glycosyltransferase involved in cell wall biosynthesis